MNVLKCILTISCLAATLMFGCGIASEDFYSLLGVDKSATTQDIRKAFKRTALKMHPDKNLEDPDADKKFIRINRAYEVLKDEELRKKYDQFGEEGLDDSHSGKGYHSWTYYRDNFGIYDDDPEIITLSRTDFDASVSGSDTPWFINFYHPMCSHCHTLAPDWRWLSIELQGVVRIGAVNCDDEYLLCSQQGVRGYPSLIAYPGKEKFYLEKTRELLASFILDRLPTGHGIPVTTGMLYNMRRLHSAPDKHVLLSNKPWLLASFSSNKLFDDFKMTLTKLAAIFSGVMSVGRLDCSMDAAACKSLNISLGDEDVLLQYYPSALVLGSATAILADDRSAQDIAKDVLALLPPLPLIDNDEFTKLHSEIVSSSSGTEGSRQPGWLVQFSSENDDVDDELRKLAGLAAPLPCHRVLCSSLSPGLDCDSLSITKTPAFVLFKPGGGYEMHHGRLMAQDIANFAREAAGAPHFCTLTPKEFPSVLSAGSIWFIDFYAPWCPPCMRLLPQFRKASVLMQLEHRPVQPVHFGIVDCTVHGSLCSRFNVRSYPTTILYNGSVPHQYSGHHNPHNIVEFVKDILNPTVQVLSPASFKSSVLERRSNEIWVVDFFANWCGPCIAMAPEYRRFSRIVSSIEDVFVASVDCADYGSFCSEQGVRSYPTVRIYRPNARPNDFSTYNDYARDAASFKRWLYSHLPSSVTALNDRTFEQILRSSEPWLVDFFAPWCGHCHVFAPEFEDMARRLEGKVKLGKVDCQAFQWLCQGAGVGAYPTVMFYKGALKTQNARQNPRGELLNTLDPDAIVSHLTWRLQQEEEVASRKTLPKDEL
ncbi:dnaJ homolog subfamily C member 10-like [Hyalella azteca]|uniref:DnaJ homolog subfamily C member 10 n=1 Tax=Hyalella azteca TaxID=294128 RepID=A0A8B7PHF6_HYAAZ|nr:dnaJ homolog subfamily C member 10-like [Hyalella azteca]